MLKNLQIGEGGVRSFVNKQKGAGQDISGSLEVSAGLREENPKDWGKT